MSFEPRRSQPGAHGPAASAASIATPGKRTQVELLPQPHGGHSEESGHTSPKAAGHSGHAHEHNEQSATKSSSGSGVDLAKLEEFIGRHEGRVGHVYRDSRGYLTAGIGHLLTGGHYHVGQPISAAQITSWFHHDVASAIAGARHVLGTAYDRLDEARKMVVIDMVFNLGSGGFGEFHDTIHAIQAGHYAQAAENMLHSQWASQVGHRATENAAIMRTGHLGGGGGTDGGHGGSHHDGSGGGTAHAPTLAEVREGHGLIRLGETGHSVTAIQRLLHVTPDGIFGHRTLKAVEKYQHEHHLEVDGIVGPKTLGSLDHRAPSKPPGGHGHATGGAAAPSDGQPRADGGHGGSTHGGATASPHGKWSQAPSLDAVKNGTATLHEGEKGGAVKHVQHLLAVDPDEEFGPATHAAVVAFQRRHHEGRHDGVIDAHTLALLTKHPVGSIEGESHNGTSQRQKLFGIAHAGSAGRRPDGYCYMHVCRFLHQCGGYGKIKNPATDHRFAGHLAEAHDFADLMNSLGPAKFGLERVTISSPYDAPLGSIVVVAAGSPGTRHPTAGDIAIASGHGHFYNGGEMGYGGRETWSRSERAKLLGCYVPL